MMAATARQRSGSSTSTLLRRDRGLSVIASVRGAAVRTGVKDSGDLDLAVLAFDEPMNAAGVFTKNAMAAAPVTLSRTRLHRLPSVRSIVINAGNANALTGRQGERDARRMVDSLEQDVGGPGLVLSTGIIGVPLPIDRVCGGITEAARRLSTDFEPDIPRAIRTTDTCNKQANVITRGEDVPIHVGGIAKGSGMIHPNMATMLAVVATDAPVAPRRLQAILDQAVNESFHRITVDGDSSTNDAVILLAPSSEASAEALSEHDERTVREAVTSVCQSLAEQIVADGEGATRMMHIEVRGAESSREADAIAKAIACSSLVKTALAGGDPNWGRILAAAGNAGVPLDPTRATLCLGPHTVYRCGEKLPVDQVELNEAFSARCVRIRLDLGLGQAAGRCLTTDLTKAYVAINSEYTT